MLLTEVMKFSLQYSGSMDPYDLTHVKHFVWVWTWLLVTLRLFWIQMQ